MIHPVKQSKKNVPAVCVRVQGWQMVYKVQKYFRYYTTKQRQQNIDISRHVLLSLFIQAWKTDLWTPNEME